MRYSPAIRAEIKKLFVNDGKSPITISNIYKGNPTMQSISNWANAINKEGKNWKDEREDYEQYYYEQLSPKNLASKIMMKIDSFLSKSNEDFNVKDADALSKLRVSLEKITDKRYQIPMMYQLLQDEIVFLREHYPELSEEPLINAIRHFKNTLKERLG